VRGKSEAPNWMRKCSVKEEKIKIKREPERKRITGRNIVIR